MRLVNDSIKRTPRPTLTPCPVSRDRSLRTRWRVSRPVWTMASATSAQGIRPENDAEV